MSETRKTVCNRDCPDACSIVATIENGRATRLGGDPEHPVTRGFLCYRTSHFLEQQYSPDRITTPLVREGDSFRPISWDAALDLAAQKLTAIRAESGAAAIFHYRSGGTLGMLPMLTDRFFHHFGPCTSKRGDICSGAGDAAQLADFGEEDSHDLSDLLNSKQIVLWGKNVFVSSPHTIPVLRDARARGAELVLIDPVHHKTATLCQRYYQPAPGSDFALAMAVAHVIFARGWCDADAPKYCDHLPAFEAMARARTVDAWCAIADVETAVAVDLAARLAQRGPAAILVGWGMGRRVNGSAIVRALDALSAISGNIGIAGGGVSFYFKRRRAFDTSWAEGFTPARTICEPLFGREILEANDPPVRAVWITAGNPVAMLPESETSVRALASREFVVVADSFLTDTARLAHLILPTTTLLEADDVMGAYGHHYLGVARPVVDRPDDVRSDLEIMQGLAERTGLRDVMAGSAREWKERFIAKKLGPLGITLDRIEREPVRNPLAAPVLFADRVFPTSSGRMQLVHDTPAVLRSPSDASYPLTLLSLSTEKSQSSQWPRVPDGPATCTVHPDAANGIAHGVIASLESAIGAIRVRVLHDSAQRRDVAIVPKGGHLRSGRCANALVRAQVTDAGEGGALYDEPVRLRRLEPSA